MRSPAFKDAMRAGAIAGIVTIFLAAVGLIGNFTELLLIGTQITCAGLILILPPLIAGWVSTAPKVVAGDVVELSRIHATVAGVAAGAVAGGVFGAFVVFVDTFGVERIRAVFLNISPTLMEFLTRGRPAIVAALIITAVSAIAGAAGAWYRTLPTPVRKPIGAAVTITLLMAFLQRIIPIAMDELGVERDWLYSKVTGGLTWIGAIVVASVAAGISVLKQRKGDVIRDAIVTRRSNTLEGGTRLKPLSLILMLIGLALLLIAPQVLGSVISEVLGTVMVFALLGLGLNIVVGYAGLLDLGYVFFFTLGAYSLALLTGATLNTFIGSSAPAVSANLNFYVAIPVVIVIAAVAGVLVGAPVLRLRGDYLALVTLGLGEMIVVLVTSPWLEPLVGGPQGMRDITNAEIGGFGFREPQHFYYLAFAFRRAGPVRLVAAGPLPYRAGVDRVARRRAGCRCHGGEHNLIQAARLRDRWRDRVGGRRLVRGEDRLAYPLELRGAGLDPGARYRDPGRYRKSARRHRRFPGPGRTAWAPPRVRGVSTAGLRRRIGGCDAPSS